MSIFTKLTLLVLMIGIVFKLTLTSNGNFLFNMDNARDMVDVREMVVLGKPRLIGPTSAIEGLFTGPAWYYLLAIPFFLSGGDPYAPIILQITLWVIGGFFLLKIVSLWNKLLILPIGFLWIASYYVNLATSYAFNPNPVTLLTPLFIFFLYKFFETKKFIYSAVVFFLGGLFFNFEMNFGFFIPPIIFFSVLFLDRKLLKVKTIWLGSTFFILSLLPQLIFEIRHNFFMSSSVINFLKNSQTGPFDIFARLQSLVGSFFGVFLATLMNHRTLSLILILLFIPIITKIIKQKSFDKIALISFLYIFIPFLGYLFLPVTINTWHLGGPATASIILIGFLLKKLWEYNLIGKAITLVLYIIIFWYSVFSIGKFFFYDRFIVNADPSLYKSQISVIDYIYKQANGENFKVYVYMPSIIDYPYQYLFWWYGNKKYGYIPYEYAYAPNKPEYVSNKQSFSLSKDKSLGSKDNYKGLVFLIKEPNRGANFKSGWEADYRFMQLISSEKLGNIDVEVRREIP